jgi:AAA domain, putative AbiEii toxin, Type IV TA system
MYFNNITLRNVGPIETINYDFEFNDDGNPKPLILVGTNGSGKSILLSYLLNSLMAAQQVAFDDAEVESGKVYKLRSPQYVKSGATYNYARVNFVDINFSCYEWQLLTTREQHVQQFGDPGIDNSFSEIPAHDSSIFNTNFNSNPVEVSKLFGTNCVLYFPPNRFEEPAWLNEQNLNASARFVERQNMQRVSNRRIIQQSPLADSKNWLLDIVLDRSIYDMKTELINVPIQQGASIENILCNIFVGYQGNSNNIWEASNQLIKLVFRTEEDLRFAIGPRQGRTISIMKNEKEFIRNIFQLSTGQISIVNIVLSILRDFDMSGAPFEKLEDVRGVVIIDEVDAHLHTDLQCNLLPEVIRMFPKVQFVLTTQSPLFLLGMKKQFGDSGFDILSIPSGSKINVEEFDEFQSAFEFYQKSDTFRSKIEFEINKSQKPIIFVEGNYDIKYLQKAAELLGKESILGRINLQDGEGWGNLDKIWKNFDNRLTIAVPKVVGLIYDCDTNKSREDRHIVKKRIIPSISDSPISKGIENLFPASRIEELRSSHSKFFDITPEVTRMVRGIPEVQSEICEVNKQEKRNLCEWLCANGTHEDFAKFESVFAVIEELAGLSNESDYSRDNE